MCFFSSCVELTRPHRMECELLTVQCRGTVEFLQLMCGHLNLTLLLIYDGSLCLGVDFALGKIFQIGIKPRIHMLI